MQFDSLTFIVFFALVLAGAALARGWGARKNFLLVASYVFYGAWNPAFVLLLAGSSIVDWLIARRVAAADDIRARRGWLLISLAANLGTLAVFKYGNFLRENAGLVLAPLGIDLGPAGWSLVLPVGISFYTFQSLSYTIDVYRRQVQPIASLRDFCLYVAFFPQLVAGPIVRFSDFEAQLRVPRAPRWATIGPGLGLMAWGLFEKIVLADSLFAPVADASFAVAGPASAAAAWAGILAFAGQIFCDFAGYSCCAIGAARCLGFYLPRNFANPYAALGFGDFWRRWHVSLSTWLRDYLYVPLGGNRGARWKTYRNLMLTMLLGGLWHGASWNFVLWGGLHGAYLAFERALRDRSGFVPEAARLPVAALWSALTLVVVVLTWIPFRAPDLAYSAAFFARLFVRDGSWFDVDQGFAVLAFAAVVAVQHVVRSRSVDELFEKLPAAVLGAVLAMLVAGIVLSPGETHAFIYFQF
jgi:D-alanyl-lipoteichoic acid acyltransferase DltB (MBOAT superfamily)